MSYVIREFALSDYHAALDLWRACKGVELSAADSYEAMTRYLERNPGMSVAAEFEGRIVGTVLCGNDGRRGYLHHVAVHPDHRRRGLGRDLIDECVRRVRSLGIDRIHLFVRPSNEAGKAFWRSVGWFERSDIVMFSVDTSDSRS